jgi:hypothetical protein
MPDYYASIHEDLMLNFFTEGKGKVVNKTRIVFGRDRDGYLIKLFLWLGIIPELSSGV